MSKRSVTYTDCDRCEAVCLDEPVSFRVHVGWISCPAGGSSQQDNEDVDLCPRCASQAMSEILDGMHFESAKAWLGKLHEYRKGVKR